LPRSGPAVVRPPGGEDTAIVRDFDTEPIPRVPGDRRRAQQPDELDVQPITGHGHGHGPAAPASKRVRTLLAVLLVPFAIAAVVGTVLLFPFGGHPDGKKPAGQPVNAQVTGVQSGSCSGQVQVGDQPVAGGCFVVTVRMTDGDAANQQITVRVPNEPSTPRFAVGDKVVLGYAGGNPTDGHSYQLVDFQRGVPLALLAALFAIVVLVLGRWQGLTALLALGLSFAVLALFVLPAIIAGENPLLVGIFGAGLIMFAVLYLTHGLSARTSTAVLGTMISLAMIGLLGALWAAFADLTGFDEDTSTLIGLLDAPIDTRGLLLAGVVIGALGVLDDVTVTQPSAVWELRAANPTLTRRELYNAGLRIGRDHVASAVNTLVMAYAGAALPLLLYSSIAGVGLANILGSQTIAQEIVRTLVGSIGLIAAAHHHLPRRHRRRDRTDPPPTRTTQTSTAQTTTGHPQTRGFVTRDQTPRRRGCRGDRRTRRSVRRGRARVRRSTPGRGRASPILRRELRDRFWSDKDRQVN
jgi:uncharacterized membrane protein